jgi:hypothetical protein
VQPVRVCASALPSERRGPPPRIAREARLQLIALACELLESDGRVTPKLDENGRAPCGTSSDGSAAPKCSVLQGGDVVRPESSNGYTGRILRLDNAQSDFRVRRLPCVRRIRAATTPNNPESYRQPMVTRPSFLQLVCQKPSQRSYMSNILLGIRRRLRQLADTHRLVDDVMGNNTMNVRSLTGRHASNKWFGNAAVATIRNIFRLTISRCHCLKRSRS